MPHPAGVEVGAMVPFSEVDWAKVFAPETPVLELFVRGSVIYLGLFTLLRIGLKRQTGNVSLTDVLLIVVIADAAQNAMTAEYTSIADGMILAATIVFWGYALDWLGHKVPLIQRFIHPPPLLLVKNGRLLRTNMKKELITEDELMTQLRKQGVDDIADVEAAHMEGDGSISVIAVDKEQHAAPERPV
jgi:uncharacterized membrane protein YcaP (DUF421 family)